MGGFHFAQNVLGKIVHLMQLGHWKLVDIMIEADVCLLAPLAETGFSHRLTAYKIVGHFFGLSYRKISGHNQVNFFF